MSKMDMAIDDYSTEKHIPLLRKWLEQCDRHHDDRCKAVSIADRPSWQVPDWVIDTNEGCIVPGSSIKQYAALSYVWESPSPEGSRVTSERLMLCHDNIEEFQRPGFLSADVKKNLPASVQDSIVLVLQSGVRYLWVDCLCIVQHTETTGDRVKAMSEIYSGAYFTIVAATTGGGLFDRKPGDDVAAKARRALLWRRGALWFTANAQRLYSSLLASHWATRGWTFQEQLLSKRSINFIDEIVFWDCECSVWWPSLAELENGSGDKSNPKPGPEFDCNAMKYDTFGITPEKYVEAQKHKDLSRSLKSTSVPNFRLYMELICRYNHRNFSYPQDALPAFSGVLKSVAEASSSRFICGLPVLFLDAALLWQPLWKAKRRIATDRGRNIAPSAPLPSWSWVGWQCLIDPESMVSGLDYEVGDVMNGISDPPHRSWKTTKLVDWHALPNKDVPTEELLKEHQWMETCKVFQSSPYAGDLPKGWSRKLGSEFVSWEEAGDAAILQLWKTHVGETPLSEDSPGPASKPVEWYFHGVQDDILYYYPIPTSNASSPTAASSSDAPFLSCVTTVAHFKVRRMLVCRHVDEYDTDSGERYSMASCAHPIKQTIIYRNKPRVEDCNSVITLEDDQGRWSGLLRVMDDDAAIENGQTIQLFAISKGSTSRHEVAQTYEVHVDNHGYYKAGNVYYRFESVASTRRISEEFIDDAIGSAVPSQKERSHTTRAEMEKEKTTPDQGQLNSKNVESRRYSGLADEIYSFYNVLWVETIDGVMYRKAAGRIPEDIWEQTCGAPQRIVLG